MNIFTRKQKWRRCNNILYNNNIKFIENNIKSIELKPIMKVKKKVRFNNIVYLTLIPTRCELNELQQYLEKSNIIKK